MAFAPLTPQLLGSEAAGAVLCFGGLRESKVLKEALGRYQFVIRELIDRDMDNLSDR